MTDAMTDPVEVQPGLEPKIYLPDAILETTQSVEELIEVRYQESRYSGMIERLRDPEGLEYATLAAAWNNPPNQRFYIRNKYNELLKQSGEERPLYNWIDSLQFTRLPLGENENLWNFDRSKFQSEEDFVDQMTTAIENMGRNRVAIKTTHDILAAGPRTAKELESVARVWSSESSQHDKISNNSVPEATYTTGPIILNNLIASARKISTLPDEDRTPAEIVVDTYMIIFNSAGEVRSRFIESTRRALGALQHTDDEQVHLIVMAIYEGLVEQGINKSWYLEQPPRFESEFDEDGRAIRRFTETGLDDLYEDVISGELKAKTKKKDRESLLYTADVVIEDTLRELAKTDPYAANILMAYQGMIETPRPGMFIAPSVPAFIGMANKVVTQGMNSLPEFQRKDFEPLQVNVSNLPEALNRILYVVNPELFDRDEGSDTIQKANIAKRVEILNGLTEIIVGEDERRVTIGDFVLQRLLEGADPDQITEELTKLEEKGRGDTNASAHYRRVVSDPNTKKRSVFFNRRRRSYGVIS